MFKDDASAVAVALLMKTKRARGVLIQLKPACFPVLGFEDGCAQKLSGPQLCQRVVGLNKRECRRLSLDARLRRNFEKIQPVMAGEVGNRHQLSFLPEEIIREARNI